MTTGAWEALVVIDIVWIPFLNLFQLLLVSRHKPVLHIRWYLGVLGKFSGKLMLSETLSLKSTAHVEGEVEVGKLAVEPGATFNATCVMKGTIKELTNGGQQQQNRPRPSEESGKSA